MKKRTLAVRLIAMLLLLCMTACVFACTKDDPQEITTPDITLDETKPGLLFGQEDFDKDMTVLYYNSEIYNNFYFDEVTEAGDVIKSALVERRFLVEEYLGVDVSGKSEGAEASIATALQRDQLAGLDQYQAALTHSYIGLGNLLSQGSVMDLYDLEDISFDEDYWNLDAIESLEIGGKAYFGSSDYNIADVQTVFYNKGLYEQVGLQENPYDLVREGKWTLETFMELCAVDGATKDNGDKEWTKEDSYGLGVRADWEFIPLVTACEIEWLTGSGYRTLNMGPGNQKYQDLYEIVEELADAEWSYMYNWGDNDNKVTIADGRFLFTMEPVKYAYKYLTTEVKFGILPYPKFNEEQKDYHSLDASGVLCVPVTVKDKEMVGKTLECLAYFSADTVNVAYYERLLGTRVANAPDDAEMLDTYIFGKIAMEPVYNFSEKANMPLGILVYTIPKMLRAKLNGTTIETIATNWAANRVAAQQVIDNTINR